MLPRFPVYKQHWFLIGLVFAFLLFVSPVSALVFQSTGKYCSGGKESCTGAAAYRWVGTDALVTSSVGDGMYLVYFMPNEYSTSRSCWAGYISGWSLSSTCAGSSYKFGQWVDRNGAAYYIYYNPTNDIGAWTGNITAQFSGTPTSGYVPLTVSFTDESAGNPTSWEWDFGDNSTHVTTQNATHQYTSPGLYTVKLTASKSGSSDMSTRMDYITVNSWVAPVAAFSCSPTNTTSPDYITCTDSSSHTPTSWLWHLTSYGVSMSPGGSYGAGIYDAVNYTQNPVFLMTGSGLVDVRLTVSNPGGSSQEYKQSYITISGDVPTPTPTPAVPWPNQTGVCVGSGITLGSGATRDHLEHFQLTSPSGDTFSGQYGIGVINYVSGQPFFTADVGQYVYQEYMYDSPYTLEWQQSYITQNCLVTTVPTTSLTVVPTPGTTTNPWGGNYPVVITYPTVPATLDLSSDWEDNINLVPATIATFSTWNSTGNVNYTDIRNTISTSNPLMIPYLNYIDSLMVQPMYWYFQFLSTIITIQALIAPSVYAVSLFASMLNSLNQYLILTTVAMNSIVSNIPMEWQNYFSLCLVGDLIIYIWQLKSGRSI